MIHRRKFLLSATLWFVGTSSLTHASVINGHMPWSPFPMSPPESERPGPWQFFTADEAVAMAVLTFAGPEEPGRVAGALGIGCGTQFFLEIAVGARHASPDAGHYLNSSCNRSSSPDPGHSFSYARSRKGIGDDSPSSCISGALASM